jgi:nucleoside-diphosphate-sugar epimerase
VTSFRTALVTGATGFIGSVLVRRLLADRVGVTCLVRARTRSSGALAALEGARVIEVPSIGAAHLDASLAGVSAEVVFHLASYGVRQADRDTARLLEGNVSFLCNVLAATSSWPVQRFIYSGSCAEYGFPVQDGIPIPETHGLRPASMYGAAKAVASLAGSALAARLATPFVTLRLFGAFGVHEAPLRLAPYLIRNLAQDEPVALTPGDQVRDLLYEDDVADALIAAADSGAVQPGDVFNVCSGRATRVRDVGEMVARALGKPCSLLHWGARPHRSDEPLWQVGDNRRFTAATSWRPRISVWDGIERMVAAAGVMG